MRILLLDIETAPHQGYFWKLWKENIGVNQLLVPGYTISWAAKWLGERGVLFDSLQHSTPKAMLKNIAKLLDEADAVVHFNGKNFDIPTLNKEFIVYGIQPPSPYKQIDLCDVAKRVFRFASNKLEFVAKFLGVGAKIKTDFDLWAAVMKDDQKAWALMERYNKQDTLLLEKLYFKMQPWIPAHPNHAAFEGKQVCPQCGGKHWIGRGYYVANVFTYHRYQCKDCSRYFRGNRPVKRGTEERFVHVV